MSRQEDLLPLFRPEAVAKRYVQSFGGVLISEPVWVRIVTIIAVLGIGILSIGLTGFPIAVSESVQGFIVPSSGTARVFSIAPGVAAEIYKTEGEVVQEGEPVMRISSARFGEGEGDVDLSVISMLSDELTDLRARKVTDGAIWSREREKLTDQREKIDQQMNSLGSRLRAVKAVEVLRKEQLEKMVSLAKAGYVSMAQIEQQKISHLQSIQESDTAEDALRRLQREQADVENDIRTLPARENQARSAVDQQIVDIKRRIVEVEAQREFYVRATTSGRISTLTVSEGQHVGLNAPLFSIVPDEDDYSAILMVPPGAIGLVQVGQEVRIRYHAFPYQRFGTYSATVTSVGETVSLAAEIPVPVPDIGPFFQVKARIHRPIVVAYGKSYSLRTGISFDADVVRDHKTILEWIFDPLYVIDRFKSQ